MRAFLPAEVMPAIHSSSFEVADVAGLGVVEGFVEQAGNVLTGVRALIDRALHEGWSLVLEGVHLVPGMLPPVEDAMVVHCVLAIEDEQVHERHFWVRDIHSDGLRPVQKYLDALDDIRHVQHYILGQATAEGVPVIENRSIDLTIGTVMELVLSSAERYVMV